jgi:hypothetical protein
MVHPRKSQALADIQAHLLRNGSRNWGSLRRQMDFIGPATFWRWVRETKEGQLGRQLTVGSSRQELGEHLLASSESSVQRIDFLSVYSGLWADATKLRAHAFHADGRVRNPATLCRAIKVRLKLLRQSLELERLIFSARAQRAFYDALVEEIARESPEVYRRLVTRLRGFAREVNVGLGAL